MKIEVFVDFFYFYFFFVFHYRKDPILSKKPVVPLGPGLRPTTLHEYMLEMQGVKKDNIKYVDPREALLKYDEAAKANPMWFKVYQENQPETIFATSDDEDEIVAKPQSVKEEEKKRKASEMN